MDTHGRIRKRTQRLRDIMTFMQHRIQDHLGKPTQWRNAGVWSKSAGRVFARVRRVWSIITR